MTITDELRLRREAVVREHMESENTQDFDATIGTFDHPRIDAQLPQCVGERCAWHAHVAARIAVQRTEFDRRANAARERSRHLQHAIGETGAPQHVRAGRTTVVVRR